MIVDTHMHCVRYPEHHLNVSELPKRFPAVASLPPEEIKKRFDHPIELYLEETEGVIDKAIILCLNFPESISIVQPHDDVAETVRQHSDKLAWCCNVNPLEKGAVEEFERCVKELGAVGMGEWGPPYQFFYTNDERCFPIYEKAIELDVPIVIHAGATLPRLCRLKYANIWDLDEVAIRYPELKIVICHIGYPKYEDAILLMQKHPNIFADISWLPFLAGLDAPEKAPMGRLPGVPALVYPYYHLLHPLLYYLSGVSGLPDKLLFGTDYSSVSPVRYVDILTNINELTTKFNLPEIPQQTIENILHENWKRVFKL